MNSEELGKELTDPNSPLVYLTGDQKRYIVKLVETTIKEEKLKLLSEIPKLKSETTSGHAIKYYEIIQKFIATKKKEF